MFMVRPSFVTKHASTAARNVFNQTQRIRQQNCRFSSFLSIEDDLDKWPRDRRNTILNVCSQGEKCVVERLGKLHSIKESGWFIAIPFIDQIRFVIDMREKALQISPQSSITKDNVHVSVSGNLFCQFVDAEKAAYGSSNPLYAVRQHSQSAMRAAIGEMELDQILHARAKLNAIITSTVQEAATAWGIEIKRYEITEIHPDKFITEAMDKQAAAERNRRKKVLEAEGDKRSAELQSEGEKIRMTNESQGALIRVRNEAEGRKYQLRLEAEGEAEAMLLLANAHADAIHTIAAALAMPNGQDAAKLAVAREYISMYADMGQKSNTMIFSDRPADINALLAQASTVIGATVNSKSTVIEATANHKISTLNGANANDTSFTVTEPTGKGKTFTVIEPTASDKTISETKS